MVHFNDIRIGNWISLNMAGDLIAANSILDTDDDELCVCIADGTEYVLLKINEGWKYEKQPKTRLLSPEEMKGIPLYVELLTSWGFQLKPGKHWQTRHAQNQLPLITIPWKVLRL